MRCRDLVRRLADDQLPQFEAWGQFDARAGFLGRTVGQRRGRFSVLSRGFEAPRTARFRAALRSLPVPPLMVWAEPGSDEARALAAVPADDASAGIALGTGLAAAAFTVARRGDLLGVSEPGHDEPVQAVVFDPTHPGDAMPAPLAVLQQLAQWTRHLALANPSTHLDTGAVELACSTAASGHAPAEAQTGPMAVLESLPQGQGASRTWGEVKALLQARNRSGRMLHLLLHFPVDYGVQPLFNEPVPSGEDWVTLQGGQAADCFWLDDDASEAVDRFKPIVSITQVDDFLLARPDLERGSVRAARRAIGAERRVGRKRGRERARAARHRAGRPPARRAAGTGARRAARRRRGDPALRVRWRACAAQRSARTRRGRADPCAHRPPARSAGRPPKPGQGAEALFLQDPAEATRGEPAVPGRAPPRWPRGAAP